jgi:GMP synthase-like glutamine amidotransferase
MKLAVIDNNVKPMIPTKGRGLGFAEALAELALGEDYEFVPYDQVEARFDRLMNCRGLLLTGSGFDLAQAENRLDGGIFQKFIPEFQLMRLFCNPILAICFGHQLMALAEDYEPDRSAFGGLRVQNMLRPEQDYFVSRLQLEPSFRFSRQTDLWVQNNHKQEVVLNDSLLSFFQVIARSEQCLVQAMQHKSKEWFGVQFHPEIGHESRTGEVAHHEDAVADGYGLIRDFVHFCLVR